MCKAPGSIAHTHVRVVTWRQQQGPSPLKHARVFLAGRKPLRLEKKTTRCLKKKKKKKICIPLGHGAFLVDFRSQTTCLAQSSFCRAIAKRTIEHLQNSAACQQHTCLEINHTYGYMPRDTVPGNKLRRALPSARDPERTQAKAAEFLPINATWGLQPELGTRPVTSAELELL